MASFPQQDAGYVRACPECMGDVIVPDDNSGQGQPLPLPLTGERLILRRLGPADWNDLMACFPENEEDYVVRWLESDSHVRLTTPGQSFYLGMQLRETGKLIGYLSLTFMDAERLQAQLACNFNPDFAAGEFSAEALDALVGFCFEGIKLHRIASKCYGSDDSACKALETVGFRREGEFLKDTRIEDGWANSLWYGLLEEEYLARPPATT
jgi:RimJ/RimL family protein N-acetyltransferase